MRHRGNRQQPTYANMKYGCTHTHTYSQSHRTIENGHESMWKAHQKQLLARARMPLANTSCTASNRFGRRWNIVDCVFFRIEQEQGRGRERERETSARGISVHYDAVWSCFSHLRTGASAMHISIFVSLQLEFRPLFYMICGKCRFGCFFRIMIDCQSAHAQHPK